MDDALHARLDRLPTEPGVYLMRDHAGQVVYVGKAASLRSRVRSYFRRGGDGRAFIPLLDEVLADVEAVVVRNEKEALLLENQLIKQHQPRFNVQLKDDKNYLSIRLDTRHPWPRAELVRRIRQDGARYFGPYESATAIRSTLRTLNRHFRLRTCSDRALESRRRACILHQIERCPAPCVLDVDPAEYAASVRAAVLFLEGRRDELLEDLRARMVEAAARLDFERAARLRDQVLALERVLVRQEVVFTHGADEDVFGYARAGDLAHFSVLQVRDGHVRDSRRYPLSGVELPDDEVVSSFVNLYYDGGGQVPDRVILPVVPEDAAAKEAWLSERRGRRVRVVRPRRGPRRRVLETANHNAALAVEEQGRAEAHRRDVLDRLRHRLRLSRRPAVMDCADVSLLSGSAPVGAVVRFRDALPDKDGYRRFAVRNVSGTDDFAMLYEVLTRHLRRCAEAGELPDLLVVDGGKGQLGVARAVLSDLGLDDVDAVGLAKRRVKGRGEGDAVVKSPERVFLPGARDPLVLRQDSAEVHLLVRLRDESHRFAITYHRQRRSRRTLRSALDEVPGVGPGRRRALLKHFGSLRALRAASEEEIVAVPGLGPALARAVRAHLGE